MTAQPLVPRLRRAMASFSWASLDQVLFALSNLVVTLAIARGGGAEGLGRYAVAFALYLVVLGCSRSLISDPLLATGRDGRDSLVDGWAASLTLAYAAVVGAGLTAVGLALGRHEIVVMAAALPVTLLHDVLRYRAFRQRLPQHAALLDGGWLLGSVLVWPVLTSTSSPALAVACWAGGALLALALAWPVLRPPLASPAGALRWWRTDARGYATPLLLDSVLVAFSSQALILVVATMTSDAELGVLRAAQVYFAPLGIALTALGVLVVPQLAQRPDGASNALAARLSVGIAGLAAVVAAAVLLAEPLLHRLLFADSITVPYALLVPLAVQVVFIGAASGLMIVSKARRRAGDIARSRLSSAIGGTALLVAGVATLGVEGAAWALALQAAWYSVGLARRVTAAGKRSSPSLPLPEPSRA